MKPSLLSLVLFWHIFLLARVDSARSLPPSSPLTSALDIDTIFRDIYQWEHYIQEILNSTGQATIFIPVGKDVIRPFEILDPSAVFYHVVPYPFTLYQLKQFKNGTRFPTLVQNKSILITSNNGTDFSIDGVSITWPDIFYNGHLAIHILSGLLDYNLYGGNANVPMPPLPTRPPPSSPPRHSPPPPPPHHLPPPLPSPSPPPHHLPPPPSSPPPPPHSPAPPPPHCFPPPPSPSPPPHHLPPPPSSPPPLPPPSSPPPFPPCPNGSCFPEQSDASQLVGKLSITILAICLILLF